MGDRALVGVRENEPRMRSLGYNTWALKYIAIIISGAFAGVAGIFLAYFYGAMVPNSLAIEMSTAVMLMVIIGGPGTLFGEMTLLGQQMQNTFAEAVEDCTICVMSSLNDTLAVHPSFSRALLASPRK